MQTPTRRTVIGGMTSLTVAAIAGCLGGTAVNDDGTFAAWIPESLFEDATRATVMVMDTASMRATWPSAVVDQFGLAIFAQQFGIEEDDIETYVMVHTDSADAPGRHMVLLGSFDPTAVLDTIDPSVDPESYAGFETVDGWAYVDDDAIVDSTSATAMIDASTGDGDRLANTDAAIEEAFDALSGGSYTVFLIEDESPHIIEGISMSVDGDEFITEAKSYFESADAAEEAFDSVEDQLLSETGVDAFDTAERDGSVLVFEVRRDLDDAF